MMRWIARATAFAVMPAGFMLAGCSVVMPEITFRVDATGITCSRGEAKFEIDPNIVKMFDPKLGTDNGANMRREVADDTVTAWMNACSSLVSFLPRQ